MTRHHLPLSVTVEGNQNCQVIRNLGMFVWERCNEVNECKLSSVARYVDPTSRRSAQLLMKTIAVTVSHAAAQCHRCNTYGAMMSDFYLTCISPCGIWSVCGVICCATSGGFL